MKKLSFFLGGLTSLALFVGLFCAHFARAQEDLQPFPDAVIYMPLGGGAMGGSVGSTCTGDMVAYDNNGVQGCVRVTDAAADTLKLLGQSAAPIATGANQVGAATRVCGGLGTRQIACVVASCGAGDNLQVTLDGTTTTGTAGGEWACGASDAAMATNVAAWADTLTGIDACAGTGCSSFTGVAGTAYIYRAIDEPAACTVTLATNDAVALVLTQGADGPVVLPISTSTTVPSVQVSGLPSAGFWFSPNGVGLMFGSGVALYCNSGTNCVAQGAMDVRADLSDGAGFLTVNDVVEFQGGSAKRASTVVTSNTESVTFAGNPGDANKVTTALCPVGAHVTGFSGRCTTTGTNCTGVNVGDGVDPDLYCANCGLVGGTSTFTTANATAAWHKDVFGAATNVTVTGIGANCYSLVYALTCHYSYTTAATSN